MYVYIYIYIYKKKKYLTNPTFDFQNSAIFAFIHDKNKRRIFQACSITHHNTIPR